MAPLGWADSKGRTLVKLFDVSDTLQAGNIIAARDFSVKNPQASSLGTTGHNPTLHDINICSSNAAILPIGEAVHLLAS